MSNVTQLKWIPPKDADGYRAPNVHEAVYDAALSVEQYPEFCTAEEISIASKALDYPREQMAVALSALELSLLYAAGARAWKKAYEDGNAYAARKVLAVARERGNTKLVTRLEAALGEVQ